MADAARPEGNAGRRPIVAGNGMRDAIRGAGACSRPIPALAALAALWLSGCGNFWQNPYATSSSGGSTPSTTTLTASPTTVAVDATVTLTATVSPSAATGTVTFYNSSTSIGSADLSSGTASSSTSFSSTGTESLTASYSGDDTYASSTSSAITVTVTTTGSSRRNLGDRPAAKVEPGTNSGAAADGNVTTRAFEAAPIHATRAFRATGGAFTAKNAEAAVVEGQGAVTLTDAAVSGAAGRGRGVLLYRSSSQAGDPSFTMTGGLLSYECDAASRPACTESSPSKEASRPATLFAVANAKAAISLADVKVQNETRSDSHPEGTLVVAGALPGGAASENGGRVLLRAQGTALKGDVIVDRASTAQIAILEDAAGNGSSLTGAIDTANVGKNVNLELDLGSVWNVTGLSHLNGLDGLDIDGHTVNNIDGGGHCVYYAGTINGSASNRVFALSGGGYLAPAGTKGLGCE